MTNKGFTLIELMIVVAIIAILSMIAMPSYHNYVARTKFEEIVSQLQGEKSGIVDEYSLNGHCSQRDGNQINNPLVEKISIKGPPNTQWGSGSFVTIGGQRYPTICTIVVEMSQKGQSFFKRGNKKAETFYINMAQTGGSFVWGCAAALHFSPSVTSSNCQILAI